MRSSWWRWGAWTAMVVAVCLAMPAVSEARRGTVYVADESGGGESSGCFNGNPCGAIFRVPRGGGDGSVLAPGASGDPLRNPSGLIQFGDHALLAADYGSDRIVRINRKTGDVRTFVRSPRFGDPVDLARRRDKLFVTDFTKDALFRVDLDTKSVHKVNSSPLNPDAAGLALLGRWAFVSNWNTRIYKVNLRSGRVGKLIPNDPGIDGADGLALSPDHRFLYVAAFATTPLNDLVRVRIESRATHPVAGFPDIVAVTVRRNGGFLISDTGTGEIDRVSRDGDTITPFSSNPAYGYPHDIVIWRR